MYFPSLILAHPLNMVGRVMTEAIANSPANPLVIYVFLMIS